MSSVGSSSSVNSSLCGNMADLASLDIKTFRLSVGFQVFEETDNVSDRFLWESTVMMVEVLAHGVSSWSTGESSEWDDGGVLEDSVHVLDGLVQIETSACSCSLISVFEMCSQIVNSALSSYNN